MAFLQLFHHRPLHREFKLLGISLPDSKKGGSYAKYTPEQKALNAKKAAEHGVVHRFYLKIIDLAFEIVLRADPSLTRFDSLAIHKNITAK